MKGHQSREAMVMTTRSRYEWSAFKAILGRGKKSANNEAFVAKIKRYIQRLAL